MRVLLTTDTIGGVWTFTRQLAEGLLACGNEVALVSFGRAPTSLQSTWCAQTAKAYGNCFTYHPSDLPLEWMQQNEAIFAAGTRVLEAVSRRFAPDILHSSQFCWGALDLDMPRLITAHSDVMSWAAEVKPDVLKGSPWLDRYRTLVQQGLNGAATVVAPTRWMLHALRQHFRVSCRSAVIYNGRTIAVCDGPTISRRLQAVTVGRIWDEGKGLHILSAINSPIPVMLAGEESFESASTTFPQGVTALGMLDEAELCRLFQQSDVYMATSVYEPFGQAPLEAALCGCAVLARDIPSLREIWGDAALYFRDAAELEAVLRDLAANTTVLQQSQRAAITRARQFTAERLTSNYLSLYRDLLAAGQAPPGAVEELAAYAR